MAAILAVSNLSFGARSAAFTAVSTGVADTLDFSVIAAAMLVAQPNLATSPTAIYSFLTTTHTDAAGTLNALALNGAIVAAVTTGNVAAFVSADNQLTLPLNARFEVRIALASSISA